MITGFEYPVRPHARQHGPSGYTDYNSYRDWLRDEFIFRCVYCLHREQWYNRGATFHIDHFTPVAVDEDRKCEYTNLVYSCATCNEAKTAILGVPDPCQIAFADCLRILSDGHIEALNLHGEKLKQVLRLDNEKNVRYRAQMIGMLETLRKHNESLYRQFMGFPDDLPDLRTKHPPNNTKPESTTNCYFALRERGQLPSVY